MRAIVIVSMRRAFVGGFAKLTKRVGNAIYVKTVVMNVLFVRKALLYGSRIFAIARDYAQKDFTGLEKKPTSVGYARMKREEVQSVQSVVT